MEQFIGFLGVMSVLLFAANVSHSETDAGVSADYPGIECLSDQRPVDGDLRQIRLIPLAGGNYEVRLSQKDGGFRAPGSVHRDIENQRVAQDLQCAFSPRDGIVAYCHSTKFASQFRSDRVTRLSTVDVEETVEISVLDISVNNEHTFRASDCKVTRGI